MINHNAIRALYTNAFNIIENNSGVEVFDKDGNKIKIDLAAVNAWQDPKAYIAKRQREYPPIGDQLDALWKGGAEAEAMLAKVQAVKQKYPKGA